jgi:hypothetical protein
MLDMSVPLAAQWCSKPCSFEPLRATLRTECAVSRKNLGEDVVTQRGQGMAADIAEQPAGYARLL